MDIYIPFTYLIGWSQQNKWYYGVRYKPKCSPIDLWTTYFTSSKVVSRFRQQYGEPDVIQVRKCFYNKEDAIEWESKALRRIKDRHLFLNRCFGSVKAIVLDEDSRLKLSLSLKGKKKPRRTKEHCDNLSKAKLGKKGPSRTKEWNEKIRQSNLGKKRSSELAEKLRLLRVGTKHSEETKRKISEWNTGRKMPPRSDEWKKRNSESQKGNNAGVKKPKLVCVIETRQEMSLGTFHRWYG